MNLEKLVSHKTVLDIGCNAGFLAIRAAAVAKSVTGMDVNPTLYVLERPWRSIWKGQM